MYYFVAAMKLARPPFADLQRTLAAALAPGGPRGGGKVIPAAAGVATGAAVARGTRCRLALRLLQLELQQHERGPQTVDDLLALRDEVRKQKKGR